MQCSKPWAIFFWLSIGDIMDFKGFMATDSSQDEKTRLDVKHEKDPLAGVHIGKYTVIEKIGEGGTAIVYRGVDTVLHRDVAIKVLHSHLVGEENIGKRFEKEARIIAQIRNANILEVYDFLEHEGKEVVVVEYMPGSNCSDLLRLDRKIPEVYVVMIALEILKGLKAAHKKGVIHRDIKPANILLNPEYGVKISDFGLAKRTEQDDGLTKDGMFIGTPSFASPEQIEGKKLDTKTDIFSLGVMLYIMATKTHPFKERGDSVTTVWFKISQGKFTSARHRESKLSEEFDHVIAKALTINAQARYQTAEQMMNDLEPILRVKGLFPYEQALHDFLEDPENAKIKSKEPGLFSQFLGVLKRKPKEPEYRPQEAAQATQKIIIEQHVHGPVGTIWNWFKRLILVGVLFVSFFYGFHYFKDKGGVINIKHHP